MNILPILNTPTSSSIIDTFTTVLSPATTLPTIVVNTHINLDVYATTSGPYAEKTILIHPNGRALFIHPQNSFRSSPTVMSISHQSPLYDGIRDGARSHGTDLHDLIKWRNQ